MRIIFELTSNPAEVPKEVISNIRILLEDFSIFINQDPLNVLIHYLVSCQASAQDKTSKNPSNRKKKISKKYSDGTSKKVNTSSSSKGTLDTSTKEPRVAVATSFAGTISSKLAPFETKLQSVDNSS